MPYRVRSRWGEYEYRVMHHRPADDEGTNFDQQAEDALNDAAAFGWRVVTIEWSQHRVGAFRAVLERVREGPA